MSDSIQAAADNKCWIGWWNPGDNYMSMHECGRAEGHGGRHTCQDKGCRSWRPWFDPEAVDE